MIPQYRYATMGDILKENALLGRMHR